MATTKTKRAASPVRESEERMLAAWMALGAAEATPGVPVSRLDWLYDAYVQALHEHVAVAAQQIVWRASVAAGGDH